MKEVKAIIQPLMLNHVLNALHQIEGLPAVTVSEVRGIDTGRGRFEQMVKSKLEIMVPDELAEAVVRAIQIHAHTGKAGRAPSGSVAGLHHSHRKQHQDSHRESDNETH